MIKFPSGLGFGEEDDTKRTAIFDYYFSNLNVMNEKPTVPNRKIYELRLSTPQSL